MTVLAALASVLVLGAMILWDIVRGRTALAGVTFTRRTSAARYWSVLGAYVIGAASIFFGAIYLVTGEMDCASSAISGECVVLVKVPQ
jgi:hypothetical protein